MNLHLEASSPSLRSGSPSIRRSRVALLTCLLCGSDRHAVAFREFDTDIVRCRDCRHVFSSYAANPHYDGFWGNEVVEADRYWSTARESMFEDFRRRFIAGRAGRLLDMGSGLGFFVKGVARFPDWQAYGCEISPAAVRYARETLGLANICCSRLEDADLPADSFDVITMWDVIDHILHPDPLLQRCHSLLREGGFCFIRTPNIRIQLVRARVNKLVKGMQPGTTFLQARDHAHHYSPSSIRTLLERNGFAQVDFVHLRPVQAHAGASRLQQRAKDAWFEAVRALAVLSKGHLNFDNLYVIARKCSRG